MIKKAQVMDNERYRFLFPSGFGSLTLRISEDAFRWMNGTTVDNGEKEISNTVLFFDLLSRMTLTGGMSKGFHRPQMLNAGEAQYAEERLARQWNIGRKRVRYILDAMSKVGLIETYRSRVASIMAFPCVIQWGNEGYGKSKD